MRVTAKQRANPTPYVFPEEYGAIGNGIADDTQAVQNAINTAATGYKRVFLKGAYKITADLDVKAGVALLASENPEVVDTDGTLLLSNATVLLGHFSSLYHVKLIRSGTALGTGTNENFAGTAITNNGFDSANAGVGVVVDRCAFTPYKNFNETGGNNDQGVPSSRHRSGTGVKLSGTTYDPKVVNTLTYGHQTGFWVDGAYDVVFSHCIARGFPVSGQVGVDNSLGFRVMNLTSSGNATLIGCQLAVVQNGFYFDTDGHISMTGCSAWTCRDNMVVHDIGGILTLFGCSLRGVGGLTANGIHNVAGKTFSYGTVFEGITNDFLGDVKVV